MRSNHEISISLLLSASASQARDTVHSHKKSWHNLTVERVFHTHKHTCMHANTHTHIVYIISPIQRPTSMLITELLTYNYNEQGITYHSTTTTVPVIRMITLSIMPMASTLKHTCPSYNNTSMLITPHVWFVKCFEKQAVSSQFVTSCYNSPTSCSSILFDNNDNKWLAYCDCNIYAMPCTLTSDINHTHRPIVGQH